MYGRLGAASVQPIILIPLRIFAGRDAGVHWTDPCHVSLVSHYRPQRICMAAGFERPKKCPPRRHNIRSRRAVRQVRGILIVTLKP
jgi:hypothetical protein